MSIAYGIKKPVQLSRSLAVNLTVSQARIETPRELVAWIDRRDFLYFGIVQGHKKLGAQRAVVHVARSHEKRAHELQNHVIEANVATNHLGELLNDFLLSSSLRRRQKEHRLTGVHGELHRFFQVYVPVWKQNACTPRLESNDNRNSYTSVLN